MEITNEIKKQIINHFKQKYNIIGYIFRSSILFKLNNKSIFIIIEELCPEEIASSYKIAFSLEKVLFVQLADPNMLEKIDSALHD